jgi:hypothetical protein
MLNVVGKFNFGSYWSVITRALYETEQGLYALIMSDSSYK